MTKVSKKAFIIFIIQCSLYIVNCFGQSITWQRIYRNPLSNDAEGHGVCEADENNFFIVGFAAPMTRFIYVLKINQWGDTIWTHLLGFGEALGVVSSGDGGCVFTGEKGRAFATKLKSNGDTAWTRLYSGEICYDIKKTSDSGYILCGDKRNGVNRVGYVCKTDSSGNLQWEKTYPNGSFVSFQEIDLAIEGNSYVIGGSMYNTQTGHDVALFLKIDNNGDTIWQKIFPVGINSYIWSFTRNNTNYILAGNTFIGIDSSRIFNIKTDLSGNLINFKIFNSDYYQAVPSIIVANNNKFYLSFWTETGNPRKSGSKVISLDSNLNIIKEITLLPDTNSLGVYTLTRITNSSDIIGCGRTDQYNFASLDIYGVRLDSALNQPPPIKINTISTYIPNNFRLYQNFPNPFNSSTIIEYELRSACNIRLLLYNILGEEIKTIVSENQSSGYYSLTLKMDNYSSGVYFYKFIIDGDIMDTKKLVLVK